MLSQSYAFYLILLSTGSFLVPPHERSQSHPSHLNSPMMYATLTKLKSV